MMRIVKLTSAQGELIEPGLLAEAEKIHRQLRPQIAPDYLAKMRRVFADGARMCVACRDNSVLGVAVYRIDNTMDDIKMYVDDLVTDESQRSQGVGRALLTFLENEARQHGCAVIALDSGTQRTQAHKFYFGQGFAITAFAFRKPLL